MFENREWESQLIPEQGWISKERADSFLFDFLQGLVIIETYFIYLILLYLPCIFVLLNFEYLSVIAWWWKLCASTAS